MRYSAIVMALSVMTAMVPHASAQAQPANTTTAAGTQTHQQTTQAPQKNTHSRAKGAAAGAAVGAVSGNAGNGLLPEW